MACGSFHDRSAHHFAGKHAEVAAERRAEAARTLIARLRGGLRHGQASVEISRRAFHAALADVAEDRRAECILEGAFQLEIVHATGARELDDARRIVEMSIQIGPCLRQPTLQQFAPAAIPWRDRLDLRRQQPQRAGFQELDRPAPE